MHKLNFPVNFLQKFLVFGSKEHSLIDNEIFQGGVVGLRVGVHFHEISLYMKNYPNIILRHHFLPWVKCYTLKWKFQKLEFVWVIWILGPILKINHVKKKLISDEKNWAPRSEFVRQNRHRGRSCFFVISCS